MVALKAECAALDSAKTVVIKVGSALLVDQKSNRLNTAWLDGVALDIAALRRKGRNVIVVSSGSIALGRRILGLSDRELALEEKQAAAAAGQVALAHDWRDALDAHGLKVAQVLLSPEDTETRRRHLNARATISTLLGLGAVPVVNENDTVTTAEIRFGDNDRLAARVAAMVSADLLVLLSDVDGLYSSDPHSSRQATHLDSVRVITDEVLKMAGSANASDASGGMVTKLEAARIAMNAGCNMIICDGRGTGPVAELAGGARHTLFCAEHTPMKARRQWIAGALWPRGRLRVDDGAARAIRRGKSLLPAGVTQASGGFDRGDLIAVEDDAGQVIAHGLSAYSNADTKIIMGHKSREIEKLLGYRGRAELIHADNLVMLESGGKTRT